MLSPTQHDLGGDKGEKQPYLVFHFQAPGMSEDQGGDELLFPILQQQKLKPIRELIFHLHLESMEIEGESQMVEGNSLKKKELTVDCLKLQKGKKIM